MINPIIDGKRKRGRPKKVKGEPPNYYTTINLEPYYRDLENVKKEKPPTKCHRCSGLMIPGYDDATCLYCGEYWCAARNDKVYGTEFPPHGVKVG